MPFFKAYTIKSLFQVLFHTPLYSIWKYGLLSFQAGGTKIERFLQRINICTQRKLLNFENWCNGEVSKSSKIWLSKSIFYVKNYPNLSQFFFHWRISIQEHIFCYWHFLIISIFKSLYFLKWCPIFDSSPLHSDAFSTIIV